MSDHRSLEAMSWPPLYFPLGFLDNPQRRLEILILSRSKTKMIMGINASLQGLLLPMHRTSQSQTPRLDRMITSINPYQQSLRQLPSFAVQLPNSS